MSGCYNQPFSDNSWTSGDGLTIKDSLGHQIVLTRPVETPPAQLPASLRLKNTLTFSWELLLTRQETSISALCSPNMVMALSLMQTYHN